MYRLAITLPLVVIAAWLFAKKRKTPYWPFVWGFIIFALIAFFCRASAVFARLWWLCALFGRHYIDGVGRKIRYFCATKIPGPTKLAEAQPQLVRRDVLSYDVAITRLSKGICPGCERGVDLKDPRNDFCPHCGIGLHNKCGACGFRKSAFSKFCHGCGAASVNN